MGSSSRRSRTATRFRWKRIWEYLLQLNWPIRSFILSRPVQLLILMAWKGEHCNCHTPFFFW